TSPIRAVVTEVIPSPVHPPGPPTPVTPVSERHDPRRHILQGALALAIGGVLLATWWFSFVGLPGISLTRAPLATTSKGQALVCEPREGPAPLEVACLAGARGDGTLWSFGDGSVSQSDD